VTYPSLSRTDDLIDLGKAAKQHGISAADLECALRYGVPGSVIRVAVPSGTRSAARHHIKAALPIVRSRSRLAWAKARQLAVINLNAERAAAARASLDVPTIHQHGPPKSKPKKSNSKKLKTMNQSERREIERRIARAEATLARSSVTANRTQAKKPRKTAENPHGMRLDELNEIRQAFGKPPLKDPNEPELPDSIHIIGSGKRRVGAVA